jgi:hypothetical protein
VSESPRMTDEQRKETELIVYGWEGGKERGRADGREETQRILRPYLRHIGNCGAGDDPEDSRCICGLRQVWIAP